MHPLIEALVASGPVVTDGAWGTELQARGLALGSFPDAWNLSHPQRVEEVARAYVEAGSQIILTNTFGANRIRLGNDDLADSLNEINRRGVEISIAGAGGHAKVFASMGPTGKLLRAGTITERELYGCYEEQANALTRAGADGLIIETMVDLDEAQIAIKAGKSTGLPVVACMVFCSGENKDQTPIGVTPEQAAPALAEAGADVIGANCGQGISGFIPICARLRSVTSLPIWIKANAGLPRIVEGQAVYDASPEEFAACIPTLIQAGANFVGGCCGTRPDFVSAICKVLYKLRTQ